MENYRATYAYKTFPPSVLIPLESKPFLSMPVIYFIKKRMFKIAYMALKQNWILRKHINWQYDEKSNPTK